MIYLILKIFIYLLLALLAGAGAGWILRHIAAARQDEEMQRTLADARARVPQFESLIRSRDEQISRLKEDLKEKDGRINGLLDEVRTAENASKDKERELKQLTARHETVDLSGEPDGHSEDAGLIDGAETLDLGPEPETSDAQLQADVARLERELAQARSQAADAVAEAAAAEAEVIMLKSELERAGSAVSSADSTTEVDELTARLRQKAEEYERLSSDLEIEQRRVVELERERELQNKSLQVLHQQLELVREQNQRAANG